MEYSNIQKATFKNRINRFTAEIEIDGKLQLCHVKNTGRLRELLLEDACVYVEDHESSERKTRYSLIAVKKGQEIVNIDSQAPNKVFYEWVRNGGFIGDVSIIKPESAFGNSRFDCYIEKDGRKIFVEVKGVTLEKDGTAFFPDAPTERGVKHINELCECVKQGYEAYIVFVVKMKGVNSFSPNDETHKEFGKALRDATKKGVNVVCVDCIVTQNTIAIDKKIEVKL